LAVFFIILFLVIVIYLFLNKRDNTSTIIDTQKTPITKTIIEEEIPIINEDEILTDENGRQYKEVIKEILTPRKTYIYGSFVGKYNGELLTKTQHLSILKKFYSFNIYECFVTVNTNGIRKDWEGPFPFEEDINFDLEKIPKSLNCKIQIDNTQNGYSVILRETKINNILIDRKLHQTDGNEVFGTITGNIIGYILDFLSSYELVKEYIDTEQFEKEEKFQEEILSKTTLATGKVETKNGQKRLEYYYSDYKSTYWGNWTHQTNSTTFSAKDFLSTVYSIIGGLIGLLFLITIIPKIIYLLPFILIPVLIYFFKLQLRWLFSFLSILLLFLFLYSMFSVIRKPYFPPIAYLNDTLNKIKTDTSNSDTIRHKATWVDYNNNVYSGTFYTLRLDYNNSKSFKSNLNINTNTTDGYSKMISELSSNDIEKMNGVYSLFDTIQKQHNLDSIKLAEAIVSFVQTIPYSVVLPQDCDASLYSDEFVKSYLSSADANCDGYEKFGINTPVEFLSGLKGDCDTRTLLLYTILSHFNYDVAIFSSNYYSHSLLGINLPFSGVSINVNQKIYILWETTAKGISPGIIPTQISNLNYWSLSLKSK